MSNDRSPQGPGDGPGRPPRQHPPPGSGQSTARYGGAQTTRDPLVGMPPLGSLPRRLGARVIDYLVVGIPVALVTGLIAGTHDTGVRGVLGGSGNYLYSLAFLLVYFFYEALMLTNRGQTLGKMAVGVRVAMLDNGAMPAGNPGWLRAATYSLPQLVPFFGFFFWLLNVLYCTWDRPYRQCLHDKVGQTVVVSTA